jgi:hypothetical protein
MKGNPGVGRGMQELTTEYEKNPTHHQLEADQPHFWHLTDLFLFDRSGRQLSHHQSLFRFYFANIQLNVCVDRNARTTFPLNCYLISNPDSVKVVFHREQADNTGFAR